jgi:hypothetical protein
MAVSNGLAAMRGTRTGAPTAAVTACRLRCAQCRSLIGSHTAPALSCGWDTATTRQMWSGAVAGMVAVIVGVDTEAGTVRLGGTATTVAAKKLGLVKPTLGTAQ